MWRDLSEKRSSATYGIMWLLQSAFLGTSHNHRTLDEIKLLRMCKMVELKINTKYRVMGLPENVGRIENGDIVETTDIVQNLPFVGVAGITHPESAWIKKTFLFDID